MAPELAGKEVGMSKKDAVALLDDPHVQETLAILKHQVTKFMKIEVTNELLNSMLFEAHASAASSTEKIAAVRELGKMNGLYAPEKREIDITSVKKVQQLETLSDEELVRRANMQLDLRNKPEIIDVE